ncbi:MAG: hypothetical protein AAFU53_01130 [Cyanobacteria bacterium J06632_3]
MSSPFSTVEAFSDAINGPTDGAIYTFAHRPVVNNLALLIAVGIFVWFIGKVFNAHAVSPARFDKSLDRLSSLIVVSLLSLLSVNNSHKATASTDVATVKPTTVEPATVEPGASDEHPSLWGHRYQRSTDHLQEQ